jgi:hypothetical protein
MPVNWYELSNPSGNNKQLLDEVFLICRIVKVDVSVISRAEGKDNTYRDFDNPAYYKTEFDNSFIKPLRKR